MYLHYDILKESVTYQRILSDGFEKGEIALVSRQLKKRFGEDSETIKPRLQTLSLEQFRVIRRKSV